MSERPTDHEPKLWLAALDQTRTSTQHRGGRRLPVARRIGRATIGLAAVLAIALSIGLLLDDGRGAVGDRRTTASADNTPAPVRIASTPEETDRELATLLGRELTNEVRNLDSVAGVPLRTGSYIGSLNNQIDFGARRESGLGPTLHGAMTDDDQNEIAATDLIDSASARARAGEATAMALESAESEPAGPGPHRSSPVLRLLEKRGDFGLIADDVDAAAEAIERLVEPSTGEFVTASKIEGEGNRRRAAVSLTITAPRFDRVIEDLESVAEVVTRESTSRDLSLEAESLDGQIASALQTERELFDHFGEIREADAAMARRQLSSARASINSLMSQRAALEERAAWATVRVLVSKRPPEPEPEPAPEPEPGFWQQIGDAAGEGLALARSAVIAATRWLLAGAPFVLLALLVIWIVAAIAARRSKSSDVQPSRTDEA